MTGVKALILARGLARRMRDAESGAQLSASQERAAAAGLKAMMPVGGDSAGTALRPFLDYVLASLADAGYIDTALVIGPEHTGIRSRYDEEAIPSRLRLGWVIQPDPLGTANAVLAAEAWIGESPFVVVNADNLYPLDVLRALRDLDGPGLAVFTRDELVRSSNIPAARVASFALVTLDADDVLTGIVEKPPADVVEAAGGGALVSMNCWRFDTRVFAACRDVPISSRGEFELPGAVGLAVSRGVRFHAVRSRGPVLDLSRRGDVAEVSRRLAGQVPVL